MCRFSSYNLPAFVWTFLSVIAALACSVGLYFSNWVERDIGNEKVNSMSPYRVCVEHDRISVSCDSYLSFGDIYSPEWRACTVMMGCGACLLILVALTSLFGLCVKKLFNIVICVIIIVSQVLAVILFIISLIVFPAGFDEPEVRVFYMCGASADSYRLGECRIGWAYILTIGGTCIAAVAASISWCTKRHKEVS